MFLRRIAQVTAGLSAGLIAVVALLGYATDHERLYRWVDTSIPMAMNTAASIVLLAIAVVISSLRGTKR